MDLKKYKKLTGITISQSDEASYLVAIRRTQIQLENLLGFTLDPQNNQNLYNELGKSQNECDCPSVETSNLLEPDEVEGSYRLFDYNANDKYWFIDPFINIYKIKLVVIRPIDGNNGITIKTFKPSDVTIRLGYKGISKYIENCISELCGCSCSDCMQLAVDAEWLNDSCIPEDLLYVWSDMVSYSVDCKNNIKSESIEGHSYTKFDNTDPSESAVNKSIINKYSGPQSSIFRIPV